MFISELIWASGADITFPDVDVNVVGLTNITEIGMLLGSINTKTVPRTLNIGYDAMIHTETFPNMKILTGIVNSSLELKFIDYSPLGFQMPRDAVIGGSLKDGTHIHIGAYVVLSGPSLVWDGLYSPSNPSYDNRVLFGTYNPLKFCLDVFFTDNSAACKATFKVLVASIKGEYD